MAIRAHVYRGPYGDCTNDGITSRRDSFIVATEGEYTFPAGIERLDVLWIIPNPAGEQYGLIAVPSGIDGCPRRGGMAGGNFVYTSDSRFPSRQPISVHDRFED